MAVTLKASIPSTERCRVEIVIHEHGMTVHALGGVPLKLLDGINVAAKAYGWTVLDSGVSHALGVTMAVTSEEEGDKWRVEIENANPHADPIRRWWEGTDTGMSSEYLIWLLCPRHPAWMETPEPSYPSDNGDIGRCIRAIRKTGLRDQLETAIKKDVLWAPFIMHWDAWCKLHDSNDEADREVLFKAVNNVYQAFIVEPRIKLGKNASIRTSDYLKMAEKSKGSALTDAERTELVKLAETFDFDAEPQK